MKFAAAELATLSKLLDEALDLPDEEREAWIEQLQEPLAYFKSPLRKMLAQPVSASTMDVLQKLPRLAQLALDEGLEQFAGLRAEGIIGRYRLVREVGRGGMGAVWLAEPTDGGLKRAIALKLPHPSLYSAELVERFARERDILASLTHPNIARLYDAGVSASGQPYLALEYIEGIPITAYCDAKRLGLRERIELFLQVLRAVQYAHTQLVVHRDLKPSNILVSSDAGVHLLDFGIAKLIAEGEAGETELTQMGGRALTLDYASPEQIAGQPIGTASDVYSLGVIFYELLAGQRPYQPKRDSRGALEEAILRTDAKKPSQAIEKPEQADTRAATPKKLAHLLAGDLDTIALKALKKNRAERYATADAFAQDLERYRAGLPVLAQADSRWYRLRKFVWRNKLAVGAATAVVFAIAAGLAGSLWQAHIARQEARTSAAVRVFLRDIFAANSYEQNDPVKARQRTARELLDVGAKRIDSTLSDAPEAKLEVLDTLSDLYRQLGEDEQAANMLREHIALAKSLHGPYAPEAASSLIDLATALASRKETAERGRALTEAQDILDHNRDFTSATRAKLLRQLVTFHTNSDNAKALEFSRQAVELSRNNGDRRGLMEGLMRLGGMYSWNNGYAQSEASHLEALGIAKSLPRGAADLLPKLHSYLAETQFLQNKMAAAEESYRAALDAAVAINGEDHVDVIQTRMRLGNFLAQTSRLAEGLALLQDARDLALKKLGPGEAFHSFWALSYSASALVESGKLEAGGEAISRAVEMVRGRGPPTENLANALTVEAVWATQLGRYQEAEKLLDEVAAIRARIRISAQGRLNAVIAARAGMLTAMGRGDDALNVLDRFHMEVLDPGHPSRSWAQGLTAKAEAQLTRGQPAVALQLAKQVRDGIAGSESRKYLVLFEASAALIEGKALRAQNLPDDAQPLLKQALALYAGLLDPVSPVLADAQIALADCLLDLHQVDAAKALLIQAAAIHAAHRELGAHYRAPLHDARLRLKKFG
jgi:eukaryotic-like serine/threonine-protein kinase